MKKFLIAIDHEDQELYILHREFPACLIHIRQEIPVRFIVMDLYDDIDDPNEILQMDFVEEAKMFYKNYIESLDSN